MFNNNLKSRFTIIAIIAFSIILACFRISVAAWQEPALLCEPPDCNRPAPVYKQSGSQEGPLNLKDMVAGSGAGTIEANKYCLCSGVTGNCSADKCISSWSEQGIWTKDPVTAKIYYNTANVGIGTTDPAEKLEIVTGARSVLSLKGDMNADWVGTVLKDTSGNEKWFVGANGNKLLFRRNATTNDLVIDGSGNVGIGTTAPGAKLEVGGGNGASVSIKTDGYVEDVRGIVGGNYVSSHSWTIGTGGAGIFGQNGTTAENERIWDMNPHNVRSIIWRVPSNDATSDDDGGWNTSAFSIDKTKTYRVSVWIKRMNSMNGSTYFGIRGNNITYLNGTIEGNPYFFCGGLPELNKWYLLVGYVHGNGDSSTAHYGGMYDGVTGRKVGSFNGGGNCSSDYKFDASATYLLHRTYLYYSTDVNAQQYWWDPRVEEVNGQEPTIEAMLGLDKGATQDQVKYFGGKVGIGVANPSSILNIKAPTDTEGLRIISSNYSPFIIRNSANNADIFRVDQSGNLTITGNVSGLNIGGWTKGSGTIYATDVNDKVGIGTTAPAGKLHITGATFISPASYTPANIPAIHADLSDTALFVPTTSGGNLDLRLYIDDDATDRFSIWGNSCGGGGCQNLANSSEVAQFRADGGIYLKGNVGIGTNAPNSKLEVYTATTGGKLRLSSDNANTYGEIRFSSNNGSYLNYGSSIEGTGDSAGIDVGDIRFKTGYGAVPAERMRITSKGNVGIGTTAPQAQLHISSSAKIGWNYADPASLILGDSGTPYWTLQRKASDPNFYISSYALDAVTVQPTTGNVGIGKTAPNRLLHVYKDSGDNAEIDLQSVSGVNNHWGIYNDRTNNDLRLWRGSDLVTFANNGNVGIGTVSPVAKLDVAGDVKAYNTVFYTGEMTTANDWPTCTDPARIYTIATLNANGNYYSNIEIEVIGSHRGYSSTGYVEKKKWILWVGDKISSNLIESAGANNNVGLWNGTDSSGFNNNDAAGTVIKLIVNPNCGAGMSYRVNVRYTSDLNITIPASRFGYVNHTSYSVTNPQSPFHVYGTVANMPGNVGIGTVSPAAKLDVAGDFNVTKEGTISNYYHTTDDGYMISNYHSKINLGSDKGFLLFQDDSEQTLGNTNEDVRFTMGVYNDFYGTGSHSDELWMQGGGRLVQNVGNWDAEMNSLVGGVGQNKTAGNSYEWRINNQAKMLMDINGNIGIGVTSPASILNIKPPTDVEGLRIITSNYSPFIIRNSANNADIFRVDQSGNLTITGNVSGLNIGGWTKSGNNLYATDVNDKVGIGTNAPLDNLFIAGTNNVGANVLNNDGNDRPGLSIRGNYPEINIISSIASNTNHGGTLRFVAYDDINRNSWKNWVIGTAGQNATSLDFGYAANQTSPHFGIADYDRAWGGSSGFTFMRITNSGNVGIGTVSPSQKLQVEGNIQGQRIKFPGVGGNSGVGGDYYSIYQESGAWESPYPDLRIQYHTGIKYDAYGGYGGHQFFTGYDGSGNPAGLQMQITDKVYIAGNVGIGTTAPGALLDVNGTAQFTTINFSSHSGDPSPVITSRTVPSGQGAANEKTELILFHSNDPVNGAGADQITLRAPALSFQTYNNASVGDINNNAGYNERMYINPDGNVGIGTTAPAQKLTVIGTSKFQGHMAVDGTGAYIPDPTYDITTPGIFAAKGEFTNLCLGSGGGVNCLTSWGEIGAASGWTDDGTTVRLTTTADNVGIGATTPVTKLDVRGGLNVNNNSSAMSYRKMFYFTGDIGSGQSYDGGFEIRHTNESQGIGFGYNTIYQTGYNTNQELNLIAKGSGAITLNAVGGATGNVGIGTTAPTAKLTLSNNVASGALDTYAEYQQILYDTGSPATSYGFGIRGGTMVFNSDSAYQFDEDGSTNVTIASAGKVGIGTTAPNRLLHVYKDSGDNAEIDLQSVSGVNNHWGIYNARTNNDLIFWRGGDLVTFANNGNIKLAGATLAQGGRYITQMPWFNAASAPAGYIKLVTPIVDNESNMFSIKITGYMYRTGGTPLEIRCGGYAYSGNPTGSALINTDCHTEGSNVPVMIAEENRGGQWVAVIRIGTPTSTWYYNHFTAEYIGWQVKKAEDFQWVTGETTPASGGNTNLVYTDDSAGSLSWASNNSGLVNEQGGSIELGGNNGVAGVGIPYIDFHYNGITEDYNVRLINNGNHNLNLSGGSLVVDGGIGLGSDLTFVNNKSIRIDSGSVNTTLLLGNYGDGAGFGYGTGKTASLAVEGDVKGDRLCIEESCLSSWGEIGAQSGWTDDGATVRLTTITDNVGIGTTAPSEKLTVAGGHGDTKLRLYSTGNGSDQPANLSLWASEPGWTYYGTGIGYNVNGSPYYGRIDSARGSSYARFLPGETKFEFQNTSDAYSSNVLVLKESGNVGIGTAVPSTKLDFGTSVPNVAQILNIYTSGNIRSGIGMDASTAGMRIYGSTAGGPLLAVGSISNADGTTWSEKFRVDNGGNVGIGTNAPTQKLDIAGNAIIGSNGAGYAYLGNRGYYIGEDLAGSDIQTNAPNIYVYDGAWKRLLRDGDTITASGASSLTYTDNRIIAPNEYIHNAMHFGFTSYTNNNAAPWADFMLLNSYGDASGGNDNLLVVNRSSGFGMRLYQQAWNSGTAFSSYKDVVLADNGAQANYLTKYTNVGNALSVGNSAIYDNGNIGIRTSTPGYPLHIADDDSTGVLNIENNGGSLWTGTRLARGVNEKWFVGMSNADDKLRLRRTGSSDDLVIDTNGNVGIGTNAPSAKLEIFDSANPSLRLAYASGYGFQMVNDANGGNPYFRLQYITPGNSVYSTPLSINYDGNVGIGTNSPSEKLEVAGNTKITGNLAVGGTFSAASGEDLAEEFSTKEEIEEGTVLIMGDDGYKSAKPCDSEYDIKVIGVVSDNAAVIMGRVNSEHKAVVAISGVVSVKVSAKNGIIKKGDLLTASNISGYAMKAIDAKIGTVIGKALEECSTEKCKIKALINLQ